MILKQLFVIGCKVTVGEVNGTKQILQTHKGKIVTLFNALHFEDDGVTIWKAYKIGQAKKLSNTEETQPITSF